MKELSLERMSLLKAGLTQEEACGLSLGIMVVTGFNPWTMALALTVCLSGDSEVN